VKKMSERLLPAVKAIIEKEGRILALEAEAGGETYWVLPGGKIEYGEAPVEALEREIQEEISCNAEIGESVGMYHFFTGSEDEGDQVVLTAFEADIGDQEVDISDNPADENIREYHWLEPEEFMEKTGNDSLEDLLGKRREKI
jgi:8-oxo-dGTP pyrophosphatase MutT (NUDIX family)